MSDTSNNGAGSTAARDLPVAIEIAGSALADAWMNDLTELRVDRALNVPATCTLRFIDHDSAHADAATVELATPVKVTIGDTVVFDGEVTSLEMDWDSDVPDYVVGAHDLSHRLARTSAVSTHVNSTYGDVASALVRPTGLNARVSGFTEVFEYTLRADTAMGQLEEICRRTGADWWVDGRTLILQAAASTSGATVAVGRDMLRFKVRTTASHPDTVKVAGWDAKTKRPIHGEATASRATMSGLVPTGTLADRGPFKAQSAYGASTYEVSALSPLTQSEATTMAKAILQDAVTASVQARGVTLGNPAIAPGTTVTVEGAGAASGAYPVTSVEHVLTADRGLLTRFAAGSRRPTSLVDVLGGGARSDQRRLGIVVGVVTNNSNAEKPGQIRVKFPNLSEQDESAWCRLLTPDAGTDRGSLFVPEIDDEVLVAFEDGDVRRPVVLGAVYGGQTTIPPWTVANGKVTARRIRSRRGHVFELGDGEQKPGQHVLLQLASGQKLRLGSDRTDIELPSGDPFLIKIGNTTIEVAERSGDVSIQAPNISLKASQKLTLEGAQVAVTSQSTADVKANGPLSIKSSAAATVEGTAMLTLKGGLVKIN